MDIQNPSRTPMMDSVYPTNYTSYSTQPSKTTLLFGSHTSLRKRIYIGLGVGHWHDPLTGCFSCDQAALWMVVCPCVRPSACLSHLFAYVPIIASSLNLQELLPMTGDVNAEVKRSKVKITEVNTQLSRFRIVTPVWIHIWWWNDAQSLTLLRTCTLLFFKVIPSGLQG